MSKNFQVAYIWDFSEEEIVDIESTGLGNPVRITESPIPAIFESDGTLFLYAFTSVNTVPCNFLQQYAIAEHSTDYIFALMCSIEKAPGKEIMLAIDSFCEESEDILTKEQVRKLL